MAMKSESSMRSMLRSSSMSSRLQLRQQPAGALDEQKMTSLAGPGESEPVSAKPPPPDKAKKVAAGVVAIIAFVIVAIFVGFNLNHAQTQRELQSGQVDPRDVPKTPTDLQAPRPPSR